MKVNSTNLVQSNLAVQNQTLNKRSSIKLNAAEDKFFRGINPANQIHFEQGKNYVRLVTFTGLKPPAVHVELPALQMRVTGVTRLQHNMKPELMKQGKQFPINRLADGQWKDGSPLDFVLSEDRKGNSTIQLVSKIYGPIGRVPDQISPFISKLIAANKNLFKFELSNVIAGNTKGAPTIGLRVNLRYTGPDNKIAKAAKEAFSNVLNDEEAAKKAFFYQPMKTPDEVLKDILSYESKSNGVEAAKKMEAAISNIVGQIEDPQNKKILFIGHCKPDGDTLGCILGMKNSVNMTHPEKLVDCAVDDEVTGLFRHKLPEIDSTVKHPYSAKKIELLEAKLAAAEANKDEVLIQSTKRALTDATDKSLLLDPNEKYDLVVLMDIPTPTRFSAGFKDFIQGAKNVVYIDHHPFRQEEWEKAAPVTGIDMPAIVKNNLAWIAERVPAATQQATIIASKLAPENNPLNPANIIKTLNSKVSNPKLNAAVASFVTGMWTDTGGFGRTANLLPEDIIDKAGNRVSVQDRPNFWPEGLSKWLMKVTNGAIDKKWMRDEITYDINDEKVGQLAYSARDKMVEYATKHKYENKNLGLGFVNVSYDEMQEVLKLAQAHEPETSFLDVQNAFKYSEIMGALRSSSEQKGLGNKVQSMAAKEVSAYEDDKIAVLICESEKAGELNTEGEKSLHNALRFSFRSQEGSIHAELLASLFNGGGHGGAAGGHIKGNNVTLNTPFSVKINGNVQTDAEEIYNAVMKNYEIMHDSKYSVDQRKALCEKIELVQDDSGKTPMSIIEEMVTEIRYHDNLAAKENA